MLLLFWFGDTIIKTRKKQKWQKNYKIFSKQKFKMVEGDQITNQNAGYNIHSQWSVLEWLANEDMCYLE